MILSAVQGSARLPYQTIPMRAVLLFSLALVSHLVIAGSPDATWTSFGWNGRGCAGTVNATVEMDDGSVLIGGYFTACGGIDANSLVRYDPVSNAFSALPEAAEFRGPVSSLVRSGDLLFIGGGAMKIPGLAGNSIFATLNLASGQWQVPAGTPEGPDTRVQDMAEVSGQVYVAIQFGSPGLLRFDPGTGSWIDLGVPGDVLYALHADGDKLIAGGFFETIGGITARHIAVLSPNEGNTWSALGTELEGAVLSIEADAEYIYVSGFFQAVAGQATDHMAKYNRATQTWSRVGQGVVSAQFVRKLRIINGELFASGQFTSIDGVQASNIARFDVPLNRWQSVGLGLGGGPISVYSLAAAGSDLYVGGSFREANGQYQHGVARLKVPTREWAAVGEGVTTASNGSISRVLSVNDVAILLGDFTKIGGIDATYVAQMDCRTHEISPLGGVVNHQFSNFALVMAASGDYLYFGGGFFSVSGVPAPYIARYHMPTNQWQALSGGSPNNYVYTLHVDGEYLYAGGSFTSVGGVPARRVARYHLGTQTWEALGAGADNGVDNTVSAITSAESGVYVGGSFQEAGGMTARHIAHYDPDQNTWSAPAGEVSGYLRTMLVVDRALYVGGLSTFGPSTRENLARLDLETGQWSAPGGVSTHNKGVYSLLYRNQQLLVGGSYYEMNSFPIASIGSYDPGSGQWTAMGEGVEYGYNTSLPPSVDAMAVCGDKIVVTGEFNKAGGETSYRIALLELPGPLFSDSFDQ